MRNQALKALQSDDYETARLKLGEALHTLQDFYSHANWVEQGIDRRGGTGNTSST